MRGMSLAAGLACLVAMAGGQARAALDPAVCTGLAGQAVPAAAIGLPTHGAMVTAAGMAQGHCEVLGAIAPVDPKAPPIRFQLNLPGDWNGKAVQYGGGGFNGVLITGLTPLRDAPPGAPTPLAQGYATFGTDSGHQNEALPEIQAFALNEEALTNFAYAAYKKTHDVAVALLRQAYGRAPVRVYYFGGSEGGREGLLVAQRFPADYDGVVSGVPVINWVGLQASGTWRGGVMLQDGGWMDAKRLGVLRRGVLAACDALDGLADGVVSAIDACGRAFDPVALRCADGAPGEDCLSDRQVAAVVALRAPLVLPAPMANGITVYPGYRYGGEDQTEGMGAWTTGPEPPRFPLPAAERQGRIWYYGGGAVRYFFARDAAFDPLRFRPADFAARMREISELMDATDPDLSAFAARGGKLIIKENMADYAQSPEAGIAYYQAVAGRLGQAAVDRFVRLYTTPGANHSGRIFSGLDGAAMPSHIDMLSVLDAWVERGQVPAPALTLTTHAAEPPHAVAATRPLCQWPDYPRYDGKGDPKLAPSFACVAP